MVQRDGPEWWSRMVVQGGGPEWWFDVVVQRGGTGWWYRVVVQSGGTAAAQGSKVQHGEQTLTIMGNVMVQRVVPCVPRVHTETASRSVQPFLHSLSIAAA